MRTAPLAPRRIRCTRPRALAQSALSRAGDIGGCNLTEDPIWLLGACHHIRHDPTAAAPPPQTSLAGTLSRISLRWRDPDAEGAAGREAPPPPVRSVSGPDESAVWQWLREGDVSEGVAVAVSEGAALAEAVEGCWVAYTPEETARLEAAYAAGQKTVDIQGRWYVFLQAPMQQQPIDGRSNKRPRAVRRCADDPSDA